MEKDSDALQIQSFHGLILRFEYGGHLSIGEPLKSQFGARVRRSLLPLSPPLTAACSLADGALRMLHTPSGRA